MKDEGKIGKKMKEAMFGKGEVVRTEYSEGGFGGEKGGAEE